MTCKLCGGPMREIAVLSNAKSFTTSLWDCRGCGHRVSVALHSRRDAQSRRIPNSSNAETHTGRLDDAPASPRPPRRTEYEPRQRKALPRARRLTRDFGVRIRRSAGE